MLPAEESDVLPMETGEVNDAVEARGVETSKSQETLEVFSQNRAPHFGPKNTISWMGGLHSRLFCVQCSASAKGIAQGNALTT